jgi:ferrochelatase
MYGGTFPLIKFGEYNRQQLQELLEGRATVFFATAYGNPSIKNTVKEICDRHFSSIFILPLFPHYASSSTEVVLEKTRKYIQQNKPGLQAGHITSFYRNHLFIEAFADRILSYHPEGYDHILFCYHSLPLKHIRAVENTEYCYTTACHETTRLIARRLSLEDGHYETVFQSRMSDQWQGPFAKERIIDIARSGNKKILLVAPSFVSDCLETALELGVEYQELFIRNGGKELRLVESLNHHPQWIRCLENICRDNGI